MRRDGEPEPSTRRAGLPVGHAAGPVLVVALAGSVLLSTPRGAGPMPPPPWGFTAHEMGARVAVARLQSTMPTFFVMAKDQLAWLNPEPDRWRDADAREMDQAWRYDHYVDLENLPGGALDAPDRFAFQRLLYEAGLRRPEQEAGFVYYRILELQARLVASWRAWRAVGPYAPEREWLQQRIIHDAGILGHYVMDASQPHHTTIHFNGWDADTPNPEGYTTDRDFHSRFERYFVDAHVDEAAVLDATRTLDGVPLGRASPRVYAVLADQAGLRSALREYIEASHAEVERLYRLERDVGFDPDAPPHPDAVAFAAQRIAAGSEMLATLWWTAWHVSAE